MRITGVGVIGGKRVDILVCNGWMYNSNHTVHNSIFGVLLCIQGCRDLSNYLEIVIFCEVVGLVLKLHK